jgi:hypothetical protein
MLHQYDWLSRPKCICDWLSVVKVHVDELSSTRIWQHKLCVTLSASVDIKYRLPIKIYYRICTFILIRVEIIHGSFHDIFMSPKRRHIVFAPFLIILIIILLPLSFFRQKFVRHISGRLLNGNQWNFTGMLSTIYRCADYFWKRPKC